MKHTFVILAYKESQYLKECIDSVLNQQFPSNVVIATSTPNDYIQKIAKEYNLPVFINDNTKGIGYDFNFALNCISSDIITIAHQDDIYCENYSKLVVENAGDIDNTSIIFTDYYEIRGNNNIFSNTNLRIKRVLLFPLRFTKLQKTKFFRRFALRFGNAISCPAVSYVQKNITKDIFLSNLKCNVDWEAWEKLSKQNKSFVYIPLKSMGHRISDDTTTSDIINQGLRTNEDYQVFVKMWPKKIAKLLTRLYKNSEKSNTI